MGYPIKAGQTAQPLLFLLVSSTDHISGLTGATVTVTLSKNGGAFASPSGTVSEVGNGVYKVAGNATDSGTLGPLWLHATAAGADPCDERYEVVAFDPLATSLGLSLAKTTNLTGFNDVAATAIVSGGAITTSGGAVSSVTTAGTVTTVSDKTGYSLSGTQAFNLTGNITGNLSGSVGSVTGAVASVTGNVGGNVVGSVGSLTGYTTPPTVVQIRQEMDSNSTKMANLDAAVSSRSTFAGGAVASVTAPVQVDMTQAVPLSNSPHTHGDALNAARAQGFGKWTIAGTTLTMFASDGTTAVRTFTLSDATDPTSRT